MVSLYDENLVSSFKFFEQHTKKDMSNIFSFSLRAHLATAFAFPLFSSFVYKMHVLPKNLGIFLLVAI